MNKWWHHPNRGGCGARHFHPPRSPENRSRALWCRPVFPPNLSDWAALFHTSQRGGAVNVDTCCLLLWPETVDLLTQSRRGLLAFGAC
ncbi:Uncharacterised protein [Vibrio cholerae]|nr:Uncharacterised protein [Vibrio cholerae]CSB10482.1 Uncharacterised protein [Vibrio cholerae]CSC39458.1 Uncharacterised protein [Vibrio cholerae]